MVKLLLGLDAIPKPHDAADALAVAICHLHCGHADAAGRRQRHHRHGGQAHGQRALEAAGGDYRTLEMIARLFGKVLEKHPNRVIVDVSGVGYDVQVPLSTFYGCGEPGAAIALRIHTHVREDQLALYGFATDLELVMFEKLIAVSGIGPKLALSVLSGIEPRDLVGAIQRNDLARLTGIPGVGKKTAERMCVELRDRLPKTIEASPGSRRRFAARRPGLRARESWLPSPGDRQGARQAAQHRATSSGSKTCCERR